MKVEKKLAEMGLALPPAPAPIANFVAAVRTGNLLFVAGHIPRKSDGGPLNPGKLGRDVTIEQGYQSARLAAINCLASIKANLGDLEKVKRVVKLLCMINGTPEFGDQPKVANGASDLLVELYSDQGRHARSAVGMGALPGNNCVEIEMIVEVED